jgi:hypothetical protein
MATIAQVGVTSPAGGSQPVRFGHVFRRGQCTDFAVSDGLKRVIKRRWPGGSVKHAIISGIYTFTAGVEKMFTLTDTSGTAGTPMTVSDITGNPAITATVTRNGVAWSSLASATHQFTHYAAENCIQAVFLHAPLAIATNYAVIYYVTAFSDGRVWVRVHFCYSWNVTQRSVGWKVNVPVVITIGGTVVQSRNEYWVNTEIRGQKWIGTVDTNLSIRHDTVYLKKTRLFPNYDPDFESPSATILNGMDITDGSAYRQSGLLDTKMGKPGFHGDIGPMTEWDALYFTTHADKRTWHAVTNNPDFQFNYGTSIWRDPTTWRPTIPSDYPEWGNSGFRTFGGTGQKDENFFDAIYVEGFEPTLPDPPSGDELTGRQNNCLYWTPTHHPSPGFLAYCITGDIWHLESMGLISGMCYGSFDVGATGSNWWGETGHGTRRHLQSYVRDGAWAARTIAQYTGIAPDGDAIAADYRELLAFQFSNTRSVISQPGASQLGVPYTSGTYPGSSNLAYSIFLLSYLQQAFKYALDIDPGFTDSRERQNHEYVTKFIHKIAVGITGNELTGFGVSHCGSYIMVVGPTPSAEIARNFPTVFFNTWAECWAAQYGAEAFVNTFLSDLQPYFPFVSDYVLDVRWCLNNAVEMGLTNASASWDNFQTVTNYGDTVAVLNNHPIYGAVKRDWVPIANLTSPSDNATITYGTAVPLVATCSITDGEISKVEFYRDGTLVGTATVPTTGSTTSGTWTYSDTGRPWGRYTYEAWCYSNETPAEIIVTSPVTVAVSEKADDWLDVALATQGGTASASSSLGGYPASAVINGDRRISTAGPPSGNMWADNTAKVDPDWVQVTFSGPKTIGEIHVRTYSDDFSTNDVSLETSTAWAYGVKNFDVQYYNGSDWVTIGSATENGFALTRFPSAPVTTTAVRVYVNECRVSYARVINVEAYQYEAEAPPSSGGTRPGVSVVSGEIVAGS